MSWQSRALPVGGALPGPCEVCGHQPPGQTGHGGPAALCRAGSPGCGSASAEPRPGPAGSGFRNFETDGRRGGSPISAPSQQMQPEAEQPPPAPTRPSMPLRQNMAGRAVRQLHARWAAEEAMLRRSQPGFSLQKELQHPEMRRLMCAAWDADGGRLPSGPLQRCDAAHSAGRGAGRGGAHPPAQCPSGRKWDEPRPGQPLQGRMCPG